ncbi:MAG: methionyl-tRNA formyltransferase [Alphaproteobacteria bacterium]|nr:methionyl-tRNA formyltransferase [Alphaproteobacteria bacterium]
MTKAIIATTRPWNIEFFRGSLSNLSGDWRLLDSPEMLTDELVACFKPEYIFFPHWSWRVPPSILNQTQCVCFHMTDVPYGRGGSPLQNLIVRGHTSTVITALKMVQEMDAGPVYLKRPLDLNGRAQEIYNRATRTILEMIDEIVRTRPAPVEQSGEVTLFARRKPEESCLPQQASLNQIYDHIRMLDADTYPHAFLDWGEYRLEFRNAQPSDNGLSATVQFIRKES